MKSFKSSYKTFFGAICFIFISYYKVAALEYGEEGVCICEIPEYTYPCCCNNYNFVEESDKCVLECPCYNNATCDNNVEGCQCVGRWGGDNCTDCVMGNCVYACKHCFNGEVCEYLDVECVCTERWDGKLCDVCETGWDGELCDVCKTGYSGSECKICEDGYYGDGCSYPCKCYNGATTCDHVTGVCECQVGWKGDDCSVCDTANHPSKCDSSCKNCYNGHWCSPSEGDCWCASGWMGPDCNVPCQQGYYGDDCNKVCECYNGASCDRFSGECNCASGWEGQHCTDCVSPAENDDCYEYCSHCINGEDCYPIDQPPEPCECSPGWTGSYCDMECSKGYYGEGCSKECRCYNEGTCNHITGVCTCKEARWIGDDCTICNIDDYPNSCAFSCSHCTNGADCYRELNIPCQCTPGYYGEYCESQHDCLTTCYNGAVGCDNEGRCICGPGWTGDLCTTCDPTPDNDLCADTCRNCYNGDTCYPKTTSNVCNCTLGWVGAFCDACPPGTYGEGCQQLCECSPNAVCNPVNGTCTCLPNFTGPDCKTLIVTIDPVTTQTSPTAGLSTSLVIGISLGCLLVIILLVALLLYFLWIKKRDQRNRHPHPNVKIEFSPENNEISAAVVAHKAPSQRYQALPEATIYELSPSSLPGQGKAADQSKMADQSKESGNLLAVGGEAGEGDSGRSSPASLYTPVMKKKAKKGGSGQAPQAKPPTDSEGEEAGGAPENAYNLIDRTGRSYFPSDHARGGKYSQLQIGEEEQGADPAAAYNVLEFRDKPQRQSSVQSTGSTYSSLGQEPQSYDVLDFSRPAPGSVSNGNQYSHISH